MSSKSRRLPMEISVWMEKDVQVKKPSARSTLMPDVTKENAIVNRKFFSNILNLSTERYRTMSRFDLDKQSFLQNQRTKAETIMPGLLPHIEQITPVANRSPLSSRLAMNKNDQIISSSFQSNSPRTMKQSESTKKNEILPTIPKKSRSSRQQESLERINRLAQPRGRSFHSNDHVRSHFLQKLTVQELFGDIDDMSNCNSVLSVQSKSTTTDTRFQQLVNLFDDVHEPDTSVNLPSVKTIVQSNSSLQDEEGRWQMANIPQSRTAELKKHIKRLAEQLSSKRSMHLIDLGTC